MHARLFYLCYGFLRGGVWMLVYGPKIHHGQARGVEEKNNSTFQALKI